MDFKSKNPTPVILGFLPCQAKCTSASTTEIKSSQGNSMLSKTSRY